MKQHITVKQLQELGLEPLPIGELGKLFRIDFVAQIKGMLMFDQSIRDVNDAIEEIASQITIGTMMDALCKYRVVVLGVIIDEYKQHAFGEHPEFELCDELWESIKSIVFDNMTKLIN